MSTTTVTYGRLIRYRCPIKSCKNTLPVHLVRDSREPPPPWCWGPVSRPHRQGQVTIVGAVLTVTDQLPWTIEAENCHHQAERGSGA